MRPSELLLLVPPPVGSVPFLAQEEWLTALAVAGVLTGFGALLRLLNAFLSDVDDKGGWWPWRGERYEVLEKREEFRNSQVRHKEDRRMMELEGKHRRNEFKRRMTSWTDQLRLFR